MHYRRKLDKNHTEIANGFRACGWSVVDLSAVGGGVPDLLCGKSGGMAFVEIKSSAYQKARQSPTAARQQAFRDAWRGVPVVVAETLDEALEGCERAIAGRP